MIREAIVGTVEELAGSRTTLNLVRDQFETNYFGPVNIIKSALPHMRRQKSGHILVLSGISEAGVLVESRSKSLTGSSCAHRYTRTGSVLRVRVGTRRVLRCMSIAADMDRF